MKPGQFIMVWVPGVGEIPLSLSTIKGRRKSITVKRYGIVSQALLKYKPGDRIFLRGPYGTGFTLTEERNLIIGGGSGMAALRPLINDKSFGMVSAKTGDELLFTHEFKENSIMIMTDDGSSGLKGFPSDYLESVDIDQFARIYACGPELMLKALYHKLKDSRPDAEFSMERIMKCGIGICDSCSIDGRQICVDGPVVRVGEINPDGEFGHQKLDISGRRIEIHL